jgi:RNA polymerase sigma factor (TIGR02999 family)
VHEAYVRMLRQGKVAYQDRVHFFSVAANAMRRVLIDHARRRNSAKRPNKDRVDFDSLLAGAAPKFDQWLVLDQALTRLADWDARQARIVELLYFGGLTEREAAAAVGISERTVKRDWATARAWLQAQLAGSRT